MVGDPRRDTVHYRELWSVIKFDKQTFSFVLKMAEVATQISETGHLIANDKPVKMYITDYNCKLNNIAQPSFINGCQLKREDNKENEGNREVSVRHVPLFMF